jgi:hypothetical protein
MRSGRRDRRSRRAVGHDDGWLSETFAVPASRVPLFQAAAANLNPWTEAKADMRNPERGPLQIIGNTSLRPSTT